MKKILTILCLFAATNAHAQHNSLDNEEVFRAFAIILVLCLLIFFILSFLKYILDHRIKNRIIEKGIPEHLATSLLQVTPKDNRLQSIKWFCLLASTGAGLMFVYYTLPLDIHSLAIMAFSISIGFLAYYFLGKQLEK